MDQSIRFPFAVKRDLLPQLLFSLISHGRKLFAVFESILVDGVYGFGERTGGKCRAITEGFAFDDLNGSGNRNGLLIFARCVLEKRLPIRGAKMSLNGCILRIAFGYAEFRHASGKGAIADRCDCTGNVDVKKILTASERRCTDTLNGFADHRT